MRTKIFIEFTLIFLIISSPTFLSNAQNTPVLMKKGQSTQLFVHGEPFLMISGELQNSTSSSLEYMENVWSGLRKLNLNSVIASVSWEQFEPHEGVYDFSLVDGIIQNANKNQLKVCLIWFATWKNGQSSYTPLWVKKDLKRFYRVKDKNGNNLEVISPTCRQSMLADAKAFAVLMKHIKEVDTEQTVIVTQVNNEVGIKVDMDYSKESLNLFNSEVPATLTDYLSRNKNSLNLELKTVWALNGYRTKGTWTEVFGDNPSAREFFMAWQYASYQNEICKQGKKEYNLPMYVNAALVHYLNELPGLYLNGGPVSRVMDVYKAAGPDIDLVAPDIYDPAYKNTCAAYIRKDNPLFIPECTTDAGKAFYAFAEHDAICFAPFAIDASTNNLTFSQAYSVLNELAPVILNYQGTGKMHGFLREKDETGVELTLGKYTMNITFGRKEDPGYGMVIQAAEDEFIFAGINYRVVVSSVDKKQKGVIAQVWEGKYEHSNWIPLRLLNGDETSINRVLMVTGRKSIPFFNSTTDLITTIKPGNTDTDNDEQTRIGTPSIYKVTLYTHDL